MASSTPSPFLRLPAEIRLMIYELLILPNSTKALEDDDPYTLCVATINPSTTAAPIAPLRTIYHTHPPRRGFLPISSLPTTWTIKPPQSAAHLRETLPSLLPLNRQIYNEAATVLHTTYTLSFGANIDAISPFFRDLSPLGKRAVRKLSITKQALPFVSSSREDDWRAACACLTALTNPNDASVRDDGSPAQEPMLNLTHFTLAVETADQPSYPSAWDLIAPATAEEFALLAQIRREDWGLSTQADMLWAEEARRIRVARTGVVKVESVGAQCPIVRAQNIKFWVKISKSIEGFGHWMREGMVMKGEAV
ncbi:uncharacterized protein BDZ99DRAFT_459526 [Mytilinidion resinicola]|uniref:Uncharacterized protein n=1 Tax=Mytilinidion resinicola TaxID=574789 RepID=A0A6A6YXX1_9PEZI|nr:uncharacterized protein BDZ99DRAFT_459526 [Mytilinidion resinicola]KAF2813772.1 hypothetical protein BDZ99DRAFT_459526 [Mytilinidion resinicola]